MIYRWLCVNCGATFRHLPSICVAFKRYLRPEIEKHAEAYVETDPMSYRKVVTDGGAALVYDAPIADAQSTEAEKEGENGPQMSHSTPYRWISEIAAGRERLQPVVKQAQQSDLAGRLSSVRIASAKYRSEARKRVLEACGLLLRALRMVPRKKYHRVRNKGIESVIHTALQLSGNRCRMSKKGGWMNTRQEEEALFWCGLLAPVLFEGLDTVEERRQLRQLSKEPVVFPGGAKRKPSLSTLKRKLKKYRAGGFNAMARKVRSDRGKPRVVPEEVIATAIAAKKDQPRRSPVMLNLILKQQHGKTVPRSTLYRHLKDAGATRIKLGVTKQKVRKRWTCEHTHDMWASDFEYGPYVLVDGRYVQRHMLPV